MLRYFFLLIAFTVSSKGRADSNERYLYLDTWYEAKVKNIDKLHESYWYKSNLDDTSVQDHNRKLLIQKIKLPEVSLNDPAVYFYRIYNEFEVYLDDTKIYQKGDLRRKNDDQFFGYPWYIIPIPQSFSGKELKVISYSSSGRMGIRQVPLLSERYSLYKKLILAQIPVLISAGINIGLILILLVAAFKKFSSLGMILLGIYSALTTVYIVSSNPIALIIYPNAPFWGVVEFYSIYTFPIFGFWALQQILITSARSKTFFRLIVAFYCIHFGFVIFDELIGRSNSWEHTGTFNFLNVVILVSVSLFSVIKTMQGDEEIKPVIVSLLIILVAGTVESLKALRVLEMEFSVFTHVNFLVVIATIAFGLKRYLSVSSELVDGQVIIKENEKELETAKMVQDSFIKNTDFRSDYFSLASYYSPASACSGDWWGHFNITPEIDLVIVGDATGHGVPAALITSIAYTTSNIYADLVRNAEIDLSPASLLETLNTILNSALDGSFCMTFIAVVIDSENQTITYSNAGHTFPILIPKNENDDRFLRKKPRKGWPYKMVIGEKRSSNIIGISKDSTFVNQTLDLKPGDRLVIYTDGLTEVENERGRPLGTKTLIKSLQEHHDKELSRFVSAVVGDIVTASVGTFDDDVTLVALEFHLEEVLEKCA